MREPLLDYGQYLRLVGDMRGEEEILIRLLDDLLVGEEIPTEEV